LPRRCCSAPREEKREDAEEAERRCRRRRRGPWSFTCPGACRRRALGSSSHLALEIPAPPQRTRARSRKQGTERASLGREVAPWGSEISAGGEGERGGGDRRRRRAADRVVEEAPSSPLEEREETLGAGSGAPPTPWPAAASGREQGDNGRARGRGAPYPAPPPWPPPPSLKPHGRAPPLLPRSRHAAPSASSSGLPAAAPNTVSCRRDAVPRSLAPALPRGKGRRPATHRRQREQRRPELAPPPRVGRRGEMPTRPNPAVGGRCRRASLPPASTGPAPPPSADRLAAPPHAWRGTRRSPEDLRRGCRRIWAPEVGEYGNGGRRLGRGWRGK
jgi:hypothetical protein